jgi:hypothetical protein
MLVRVTYQHEVDIKKLFDNMQAIIEVIDLKAENKLSLTNVANWRPAR